jgi:hypothetical protein
MMPGAWTPHHATPLFHSMPGQVHFQQPVTGAAERVATLPEEYAVLLARVDLSDVFTVLDPWSGFGSTRTQVLQSVGNEDITVVSSDVDVSAPADHHGDALDPRYYELLQQVHGHFDIIITSPWFRMLDLAIPIMLQHVRHALFVHVPGHYLGNMPPQRQAWFARRAPLIRVLRGLPVGPLGRRCEWLCIFTSRRALRAILRMRSSDRLLSVVI